MGICNEFLVFKHVQGLLSKEGKEVLDLPFRGMTLACAGMKHFYMATIF